MSERPKTHAVRADLVAGAVRGMLTGCTDSKQDEVASRIRRGTYPDELVEAAKGIAHSNQYWTHESWDAALDELESALALYEDKP